MNVDEGLGGNNQGKNVKKLIAKLNANILPHKKRFSPPKSVLKHSCSPKTPRKYSSRRIETHGKSSLIGSNSVDSPKSSLQSSSQFKSSSKAKIDKKLVKGKILKESKIRKIVEYFEPISQKNSQDCVTSNADVETVDVMPDTVKDTEKGEEKKPNAFSILMQGGSRSTPPGRRSTKRFGSSPTKKVSRKVNRK